MAETVNISEEQIAQYQRDGAVLLRGILTQRERELLEQGVEESNAHPGKRSTRASNAEGRGETFLESFPSQGSSPSLKALLELGRIPEIAARMMRTPSAQLILDQIFYKAAGVVIPTPWHQDTPYLRVRGDDMIRVWICADYSPQELTLQIIRGSHRWGIVFDPRLSASEGNAVRNSGAGRMIQLSGGDHPGPQIPDIARYPESFDILRWDVEPGDALIFNGNMLHAAGGADNYPTARRAYTSMWGGPQLRYISPPDNAIPTLAEVNRIAVPFDSAVGDYPEAFPVGWKSAP
ncbi:phytanoyl-CoA dioxygenase family protein [Haliea sp. E17]|uniref:phytanoyl-CoA dioxygenase family protein n=1 Tax=Haliea sp. E17 TaxID=3401576 RepID=UPI003AAFA158